MESHECDHDHTSHVMMKLPLDVLRNHEKMEFQLPQVELDHSSDKDIVDYYKQALGTNDKSRTCMQLHEWYQQHIIHRGFMCHGCGMQPIRGVRYTCLNCTVDNRINGSLGFTFQISIYTTCVKQKHDFPVFTPNAQVESTKAENDTPYTQSAKNGFHLCYECERKHHQGMLSKDLSLMSHDPRHTFIQLRKPISKVFVWKEDQHKLDAHQKRLSSYYPRGSSSSGSLILNSNESELTESTPTSTTIPNLPTASASNSSINVNETTSVVTNQTPTHTSTPALISPPTATISPLFWGENVRSDRAIGSLRPLVLPLRMGSHGSPSQDMEMREQLLRHMHEEKEPHLMTTTTTTTTTMTTTPMSTSTISPCSNSNCGFSSPVKQKGNSDHEQVKQIPGQEFVFQHSRLMYSRLISMTPAFDFRSEWFHLTICVIYYSLAPIALRYTVSLFICLPLCFFFILCFFAND
ncbi:hypothetical protein RFI_23380 [Reticulomyxa filosa]|uniref:ZZ-type domain-containing protein n=1 Tax=Reticulomyxa filosa TaxID=46433 RepID=X6MJG6_RETFI|nr:hypothetical protein RFI_23380 [Reticulomyxa filosa]|eukprot:ETO13989.1 hypothetical protein RFI_23380 [Reticulomyxa filosa]